MSFLDDFTDFLIKKGKEVPRGNLTKMGGGVKTSDNQEVSEKEAECVRMILANCGEREIAMLGLDERFTRLAENFIRSNTKEDIKAFIIHNTAMKMANLIAR